MSEACTDGRADRTSAGDPGTTYIELLVSIVLIGTVVIAILTAVRATTIATRIDHEQTHAMSSLLTAAGELHHAVPAPCGPTPATYYDGRISAPVSLAHPGAAADDIVVVDVEFAGRASAGASITWGPGACSSSTLVSHRISLEYRHLGEAIATLDVVKRD